MAGKKKAWSTWRCTAEITLEAEPDLLSDLEAEAVRRWFLSGRRLLEHEAWRGMQRVLNRVAKKKAKGD